jgi:hypothetical protein
VIIARGEDILEVTFFAYEAWFHLSGYFNSQNSRICSATAPHKVRSLMSAAPSHAVVLVR